MTKLEVRAHAIAEAEHEVTLAAEACGEASTEHGVLQARSDAMAAERAAIVARRAAGNDQADDGARLALIAVDGEILAEMLDAATTAAGQARARVDAANAVLLEARRDYQTEEARLALDALDDHAENLLALLGQTLVQRQAATAALTTGDRRFDRITARLSALDTIVTNEIQVLRSTQFRRLCMTVKWMPSPGLYDGVWRSFNNNGIFT